MNHIAFRVRIALIIVVAALSPGSAADDLSGRWVARVPNNDGTFRETVFVLNQQGSALTGSVITPTSEQPFVEGIVTGEAFSFASAAATNPRRTLYRGARAGDQLAITIVRPGRTDQSLTAGRGPDSAGRLPERVPPPALHPVSDNGLARTPPMGWNSWNHFRGDVNDATVRAIADAMASNGMKEAGYAYVNIDDTWELGRDAVRPHQDESKIPGHESAGGLRACQRLEARRLFFARAVHVRRL